MVQTSSTMTTGAPFRRSPRCGGLCMGLLGFADEEAVDAGHLRGSFCACQALAEATLETMGSAPMVSPPMAAGLSLWWWRDGESPVSVPTRTVEGGGAAVDVVVACARRRGRETRRAGGCGRGG